MTVDQFVERIHPALEALAESQEPWEARREAFVRELGSLGLNDDPMAAQLLERLDSASDGERAAMLASREFGLAEVPAGEQVSAQQVSGQQASGQPGEAVGGETGSRPGYDEQAWQAYLAENGPAWDGSQDSWGQFRQWFLYYAGERGLAEPATGLMQYLNGQSAAERINAFAQYGVVIAGEQASGQQADGQRGDAQRGDAHQADGYDEQAWQAYLAENGPAWDGSQDSWEQFRQWFLYYADDRGLREPATGLMEHLDGQSAAERVSTLALYGVSIAPVAGDQASGQPDPGEIPDEDIDAMMRELLEENPELAEIPEDRRRELIIEAFNEAQGTEG